LSTAFVIGINTFGTVVSIFSLYVTYSLYQKYRLQTSIFFIISSVAVLIWNFLHLALNFIDGGQAEVARIIWLLVVISGIIFVYCFIFGYSMLRYENINWRLLVYTSFASVFCLVFVYQENWVNTTYSVSEGWVTNVINETFWSIFAISIFIANFIEIIIPLVNTYARTTKNRNALLIMLSGILLSIFSNALEPILRKANLPQALRFLTADFGFLLFFIILLRFPFTGLYDNTVLTRVIVAGTDGVPILMLSDDTNKAILASSVLISINSILEEMTSSVDLTKDNIEESTRKIQLDLHQFYIIIRRSKVLIFQFFNPSGLTFAKFKSLGGIFESRTAKLDSQLTEFQDKLSKYFSDFIPERTNLST